MFLCCWKCRDNIDSKTPKIVKAKNRKIMRLSKCEVPDSKKLKLIKEYKTSELLKSLGIKTHFNKILLVGPFLL